MPKDEAVDLDGEALAKRRVGCMVAFVHPFRLIDGPESPPWEVTVEDVNYARWDYVALHEMIGGIDVGLPEPFHMVVSRDGGVALPVLPQLRNDQEAVEFFNRCFAAMLLGGVYCEAIGLDGLDLGSIIDWQYLRVHSNAPAAANRFHGLIRRKHISAFEAVALVNPRKVRIADLRSAVATGREILDAVPELSGEFLLKGVTGIARRDWGVALANLWIGIEQITSRLWELHVLEPARDNDQIQGRVDQLSDSRTWSIAVRHELLFQTGVLPRKTIECLSVARKARNALVHKGAHPSSSAADAAYEAITGLLKIAIPKHNIPLLSLDFTDHELSDPFNPPEPRKINPTHWMEIQKLPGEAELERLEARHRAKL